MSTCFSDCSLCTSIVCLCNVTYYKLVSSSGTASRNIRSPGTWIPDTKGADSLSHHMLPLTQGKSQILQVHQTCFPIRVSTNVTELCILRHYILCSLTKVLHSLQATAKCHVNIKALKCNFSPSWVSLK